MKIFQYRFFKDMHNNNLRIQVFLFKFRIAYIILSQEEIENNTLVSDALEDISIELFKETKLFIANDDFNMAKKYHKVLRSIDKVVSKN